MTTANTGKESQALLSTLPNDDIRQIMWRYADRYDLQMLVQSTRSVARGLVARLVADGARNSHEWTEEKAQMLKAFDDSGVTAAFMEPEEGGYISGPKNLALAMIAFELSWVDAGAATCSLANNLALEPIHEKGTPEQIHHYMSSCVPPQPGDNRKMLRGAFCLTEPIPYVGVDTGMLAGKLRVSEWKEGKEPVLQVEKRGRFITNMGYANFVTAAVDSDDPRIKGSCMVILEETDPGIYDRGSHTLKMVHQLSCTNDPIFSLKIPANRIIGGYTIKDGVIVPNFSHSEVIEAVFARTRVTVGVMTSAKLLSAIEPVIRYQRQRFRGGEAGQPGTPRYELGLQMKEDALHRLVDVWATGEAAASLGFATARHFDSYDPVEKLKIKLFAEQGIKGPRAEMKALKASQKDALEFIAMSQKAPKARDAARYEKLAQDTLVQYLVNDAVANVLCPACKLWNTGHGATVMRESVSLMGGYGITEDCPGFLGQKWMDSQLEATYEGPEAVQRRQLSLTMTDELFLAQFKTWIAELNAIEAKKTGTGAGTLAAAMELWLWTLNHLQNTKDADGKTLYNSQRQGVGFNMADAICWILSNRQQILDTLELEEKGPQNPVLAENLAGFVNFFSNLCYVQAGRSAGEVARICSQLVYGYQSTATLNASEAEAFVRVRMKVDSSLAGSMLAKDRAAASLPNVMIPEALDYPL